MRHAPPLAVLLVVLTCHSCGLFTELKSADSAPEDSTGSGTNGSSSAATDTQTSGPCTLAKDDRCDDQDRLYSCDPGSGVLIEYDCAAVCGDNLNFTCLLATADGQHGCWCVVPGRQNQLTCTGLEACLQDCTNTSGTACADECFRHTDSGTIRRYGALVNCVHDRCDTVCDETPEDCANCIDEGISLGAGNCAVYRTLCDDDQDDNPWPGI